MKEQKTLAWYKQFWPWFLIALPGSVVIASVITIILAVQNADTIVVDDYYKAGLAINRDLSSEIRANELNIKSSIQFHPDQASIIIENTQLTRPQQLQLKLIHPTLAEKDQSIVLLPTDGLRYSGKIKPVSTGTWDIIIIADANSWRIQRRIKVDDIHGRYRLR